MNQRLHQIRSMSFSGVNLREQDPILESVILLVVPGFEFEQTKDSFQKSLAIRRSREKPAILN